MFSFLRRELPQAAAPPRAEEGRPSGASFRERIEITATEERALRVAAVYRAAQVRGDAMGMVRLRLLRHDRELGCFVEADRDGLNYVLQVRPNDRQSAFQFWKSVELMRLFRGSCVILPRWDGRGECVELIPCAGSWDRCGNVYTLTAPDFGVAGEMHGAEEVMVLRGVVTRQYPQGESVIHYAARTTSLSATSEKLALENAAKGGRQKLILQQKEGDGLAGLGGLDPEEMRRQAERLQRSIYSEDVIYDHSLSSITPINMNAVDLQLLDTRKFTVADIARFFGVPRALLMDDANSNYNSAETAALDFRNRTLAPLMREIEDEFNAKMLTRMEFRRWRFSFDTSGLLAMDVKTQCDWNKSRLETGVVSVNELRSEAGMPRVEGGDEHYVSCNMAPVGSAKLSGEAKGSDDGGDKSGDD